MKEKAGENVNTSEETKVPEKSAKKRSFNKYSVSLGISTFFSNNMATGIQPNYGNLFRTVILGIPPFWLGIMNSIVGILNIIGIPIGAVMMQKIRLPWGKVRSWIYVAGGLYAFSLAVEFIDFGLPDGPVKYLAAILPYLMVNFIMSLHVAAWRTSIPMYSPTLADRTANYAASVSIGAVGKFIYSALGLSFITLINKTFASESLGYSALAVLLSTGFFIATCHYANLLAPFDPSDKQIREQSKAEDEKVSHDDEKVGFWTMFRSVINLPFSMMLCAAIGKAIASQLVSNLVAFYYLYAIGDNALLSVYLSLSAVLTFVGAYATKLVAYKWSLKTISIFGLAFYGACMLAAYFTGTNAILFTILLSLGNVGLQIWMTTETPIYTAIADYSKAKTGKDASKFVIQFAGLSNKIGTFVATSAVGFGLAAIGFSKDNVTGAAVQGLRVLVSFGPAVCCMIGVVFLFLLPLSGKQSAAPKEKAE